MPCSFSFLSVCSGIEAASVAWEPLGWKACAFAEIEKFPSAVLAHHWPETPNLGDMTKHNDWPNTLRPNLIVGGTPCQAFSVAGLRKGLADPRGNLTLVFLGLLAQFRPRWVVWENVPGVLSDKTGAFGAFLGGLGELGYGFAYRVLDAQHFGVPQRRRRVFVVGYLGDWRRAAAVLFEPESLRGDSAPSRQARERFALGPVAGTLDSRHAGGFQCAQSAAANHLIPETVGTLCADSHPGSYTGQDAYSGRLIATAFGGDIARTLSARHDSSPCADRGMDVVAFYPTNRQPEFGNYQNVSPAVKVGSGGSSGNPPAVAFGVGESPDLGHCLRSGASKADKHESTTYIKQAAAVRRLTPRECERLQGFTSRIERVIISVCLDPQSGNVNVGLKCLKLPSSALIAEESESQEAAPSVEQSTKSDQENHGNAVVLHVQQSHETTLQRILSAGRLTYSANGADRLNLSPLFIPSGDIARGLVRLRQGLETLARNGKAASQVSEMLFTLPANGRWSARWFGLEIKESASDAETLKTEDITFITSNHSPQPQVSEPTQQTWLCSALSAIGLFIPEGTFSESFAEVVIDVESDHTLIPWRGKMAPDGPRYKALGNSMAVPVMRWIGERISKQSNQ